jgi:tRNA U55 pseudouridine synthase TruB
LVAVGNYTKLIPYFEKDKKTYEFTLRLDGTTASYDLEQPVEYISASDQEYFAKNLTQMQLEKIIQENFL